MLKLAFIPGLCAVAAFAQAPLPPKELFPPMQTITLGNQNSFGPIGITAALAGPAAAIPGAPYSAQAVTQRVQTLADGNRITQTTTNQVARDGKGRVYREESLPGLGDGTPEPPRLALIEDPVASVHITLDSTSKTAIRMPSVHVKKADEAALRSGFPPLADNKVFFTSTGPGPDVHMLTAATKIVDESTTSKADLGTQTIEGVLAKGTKITRTIPAGEMGNDLPLIITTETWYSPDLKLLVMSKSSDPRVGETTYKLTNISRAEPDPALFQVPADYTIKDQPGGLSIYKTIDK